MFDLIVIAVIALSTAFAVIRGGLRETGTLAALGLAAALALLAAKPLLGLFGTKATFLSIATVAGAVGLLAFVALYALLHVGLRRLKLKPKAVRADRIAGGAFGFLRGLALVGLGFLAYDYYLGEERRGDAVNKALLLPVAEAAADFFGGFAPAENRLAPAGAAKAATNAAVEGYARGERSALSEIVTTVTTSEDAKPGAADPIGAKIQETDPE